MLWWLVACNGDPTTSPPTDETDADTDADSDADADADTDADSDSDTDTATTTVFSMSSPDFVSSAGDPLASECAWSMPAEFSCGGPNPEIRWEDPPAGAVAFALILDDPDANDFAHWAIYDVPATETGLAQGISGNSVDPHVLPDGS
jgi:phosphatidylethanolamine-binding protein (PEBP) family uncharacterized protein